MRLTVPLVLILPLLAAPPWRWTPWRWTPRIGFRTIAVLAISIVVGIVAVLLRSPSSELCDGLDDELDVEVGEHASQHPAVA